MLVGGTERCARCGTQLRAGRTICPSCGLDQASTDALPEQAAAPAVVVEEQRPAPVKKSICPACMISVREDTMVEYQGGRICPECHERMKGKLNRKG